MSFSEELWASITPIYKAVLQHPFIEEMTDGSLARDRFVFYMKQDALYLQDFSRALAITGARATAIDQLQSFVGFAHGAITVERSLHQGYFREFEATLDVERAPACFAYGQYLIATATTGSYAESVAALLPCFWIYRDVGNYIYGRSAASLAENPYRAWIETYAGEHFDESVTRAIAITDAVAANATDDDLERMRRAFRQSSRLEWMFWDSAYRLEQWPPR